MATRLEYLAACNMLAKCEISMMVIINESKEADYIPELRAAHRTIMDLRMKLIRELKQRNAEYTAPPPPAPE